MDKRHNTLTTRNTTNSLSDAEAKLAFQQLEKILSKFNELPSLPQNDSLFVSTSLQYARICFLLGKGFNQLALYLQEALQAAKRTGDQRSEAMIHLHLGRLFYFSEQREEAMQAFFIGKKLVDSLGDADINSQAAELIGLIYFIQGHFNEAKTFFEQATQSFEFGEYGHSGPMWLGYCHAFLGHFNRAIGTVDYYRRMALERGNKPLSTTLRAVLGIFLVRIKKLKEASFHLSGALQDAIQEKNHLAEYFSRGALAFYHLTEGRFEDSKEWMESTIFFGKKLGFIKQYASPFVLEMIFEYHRNGMTPIEGFSFMEEATRILQEPSIHLSAVVLRLMAVDGLRRGEDLELVSSKLQQSEKQLKISGDPIQLAKTRIALARLSLKQGNQTAACNFAQIAWKGLSRYEDIFYPSDLRFLLMHGNAISSNDAQRESLMERFSEMIDELISSDNPSELLVRCIKATNLFLGTERGGLFLFSNSDIKVPLRLLAAYNISESDISGELFQPSIELICKSFQKNKPLIKHNRPTETGIGRVQAMIAIPFEVKPQAKCILYHDNTYVNDFFNNYSEYYLTKLTDSLSKYVNHLSNIHQTFEDRVTSNYKRIGGIEDLDIIAESQVMKNLLKQVDRIAETDSTVLLTGETGVGKELMARRIHQHSLRNNYPLVIVDPTTIQDTLFESELFGHEKGSFTGADSQKIGWIELAHRGTLFIDEVGEIPLSIQVKLLRALQEKTIVRVGSVKTITSDFRLIAATNRDLRAEVSQGRFREDLFYRLNVIPIHIPPLRKRNNDILLLAQSFQEKFRQKYNRQEIKLTQAQKDTLLTYEWPGNIRELKNIIERAVLLAEEDRLIIDLIKDTDKINLDSQFQAHPSLEEIQRMYITFVLEECNGKIGGPGGAAEKLGMKRTSLYARMRTLGMM